MLIGKKLKEIRKRKGLTLKHVAELTDLSLGYLSNIERDINSPTLVNLQKVCEALDIGMADLLKSNEENKSFAIKKIDFKEFFSPNSDIKYELVTDSDKSVRCICITICNDCNIEESSWGHNTDELGLVSKGTLQVTVGNVSYIIEENEAVYIPAHTPHKYKKLSVGECISYWLSSGTMPSEISFS